MRRQLRLSIFYQTTKISVLLIILYVIMLRITIVRFSNIF